VAVKDKDRLKTEHLGEARVRLYDVAVELAAQARAGDEPKLRKAWPLAPAARRTFTERSRTWNAPLHVTHSYELWHGDDLTVA